MKKALLLLAVAPLLAKSQLPQDSLLMWLRADAGVILNGNDVAQWDDQSGRGNYVETWAGSVVVVENGLCGQPVLHFSSNGRLSTPTQVQTFPDKRGMIFAVARVNGGTGGANYGTIASTYGYNGTGITWQFGAYPSTYYAWYDGVGGSSAPIITSPPVDWGIVTVDRFADDQIKFYKSGVLLTSQTVHDNQASANYIQIGDGLYEYLNGDIAEIIIYNRSLSDEERGQVDTYLANKYCFNSNVAQPMAQGISICGSSSVQLEASGGVTYRWYDSMNATSPVFVGDFFTTPVITSTTTYYVANYNDTLESVRVPVTITYHDLPSTPLISIDGMGVLSANSASTYQWYLGPDPISGATSQDYLPAQNGSYTVTITDANGCESSSAPFEYLVTSVGGMKEGSRLKVYPNPSKLGDAITLTISYPATVVLSDATGRVLSSWNATSNTLRISLNGLERGVYLLSKIGNDGTSHAQKLIID